MHWNGLHWNIYDKRIISAEITAYSSSTCISVKLKLILECFLSYTKIIQLRPNFDCLTSLTPTLPGP